MTAKMQINMDSETKRQFIAICDALGMSASTAFNVLARAVVRNKGLPSECVKLDVLPDDFWYDEEFGNLLDTSDKLEDACKRLDNGEGQPMPESQKERLRKLRAKRATEPKEE
jgi:addiction module RelB/DinJ family antitoxin